MYQEKRNKTDSFHPNPVRSVDTTKPNFNTKKMWQVSYSCFELRERRGKVRLERMDPGFCSESRSRTNSVSRFLVQPRETPFHRRSEQIDRNRASVIFTIERCVAAAIGLIERKLCRLRQEEEVAKTKKQQQQRCKKRVKASLFIILSFSGFLKWAIPVLWQLFRGNILQQKWG